VRPDFHIRHDRRTQSRAAEPPEHDRRGDVWREHDRYGFRVVIADRFHPAQVLALIEREHVQEVGLKWLTYVGTLIQKADEHNGRMVTTSGF
jgi:hypothetical protein